MKRSGLLRRGHVTYHYQTDQIILALEIKSLKRKNLFFVLPNGVEPMCFSHSHARTHITKPDQQFLKIINNRKSPYKVWLLLIYLFFCFFLFC